MGPEEQTGGLRWRGLRWRELRWRGLRWRGLKEPDGRVRPTAPEEPPGKKPQTRRTGTMTKPTERLEQMQSQMPSTRESGRPLRTEPRRSPRRRPCRAWCERPCRSCPGPAPEPGQGPRAGSSRSAQVSRTGRVSGTLAVPTGLTRIPLPTRLPKRSPRDPVRPTPTPASPACLCACSSASPPTPALEAIAPGERPPCRDHPAQVDVARRASCGSLELVGARVTLELVGQRDQEHAVGVGEVDISPH